MNRIQQAAKGVTKFVSDYWLAAVGVAAVALLVITILLLVVIMSFIGGASAAYLTQSWIISGAAEAKSIPLAMDLRGKFGQGGDARSWRGGTDPFPEVKNPTPKKGPVDSPTASASTDSTTPGKDFFSTMALLSLLEPKSGADNWSQVVRRSLQFAALSDAELGSLDANGISRALGLHRQQLGLSSFLGSSFVPFNRVQSYPECFELGSVSRLIPTSRDSSSGVQSERMSDLPPRCFLPAGYMFSSRHQQRYRLTLQLVIPETQYNTETLQSITATVSLLASVSRPKADVVGGTGETPKASAEPKMETVVLPIATDWYAVRVRDRSFAYRTFWEAVLFPLVLLGYDVHEQYLEFPLLTDFTPDPDIVTSLVGLNITLEAPYPVPRTLDLHSAVLLVDAKLEGLAWWVQHHPWLTGSVLTAIFFGVAFSFNLSVLSILVVVALIKWHSWGGSTRGATRRR